MIYLWNEENTPLFDKKIVDQAVPSLTPYIVDGGKACVIICPGGGYTRKSVELEGTSIARWLNQLGVSVFVLDYRVAPYHYPASVYDAKRAIRFARYSAKEYGYDSDKIGIMGFSAGGHLACCTGTMQGNLGYENQDAIDEVSDRPDFMILGYPVISMVQYPNIGTFINLLGEGIDQRERIEYSLEKRVTRDTPPTFLWHTISDNAVLVENSLLFAAALSRYSIPFEIHTFKDGPHGLGLAPKYPHTAKWIDACENWLSSMNLL